MIIDWMSVPERALMAISRLYLGYISAISRLYLAISHQPHQPLSHGGKLLPDAPQELRPLAPPETHPYSTQFRAAPLVMRIC